MNKNQNMRRVLSLLFVLSMLVCMMVIGTVVASAEGSTPEVRATDVASVTVKGVTTNYTTFDAAWEAMNAITENVEVKLKLLANVTVDRTYTFTKSKNISWVIDSSRYTITGTNASQPLFVVESGRLVVENIMIESAGDTFRVNGGSLELQCIGTDGNKLVVTSQNGSVIDLHGGSVAIEGGTALIANGTEPVIRSNENGNGILSIVKWSWNITSSISAPNADAAIEWDGNGSLNVSFGEVSGNTAISASNGKVTVSGSAILSGDTALEATGGNITINGGTLNAEKPIELGGNTNIAINGGDFGGDVSDLSAFVKEGHFLEAKADGTYAIAPIALTVNDVPYSSWANAAAANVLNQKEVYVVFYSDIVITDLGGIGTDLGTSVVVDLNGYDWTVRIFSFSSRISFVSVINSQAATKTSTIYTTGHDNRINVGYNTHLQIGEGIAFDGTVQLDTPNGAVGAFSINGTKVIGKKDSGSILESAHTSNGTIRITYKNNFLNVTVTYGHLNLAKDYNTSAGQNISILSKINILDGVTLTLDPETKISLGNSAVLGGEGTIAVSSLEHFKFALASGIENIKVNGVLSLPEDYMAEFNGKTVTGTILGTVRTQGGLWITAEGLKMIGVGADYYATEDAIVTVAPTLLTVKSGVVTLAQSWRTLQGQNIVVAEGATFVVPADMTFTVYDNTNVTVKGTLETEGTIELRANSTFRVKTLVGNLNVVNASNGYYLVKHNDNVYSEVYASYKNIAFTTTSLVLGNTIGISFNFNSADLVSGVEYDVVITKGANTYELTLTKGASNVVFNNLAAREMCDLVTVAVYYNGTLVSNEASESVKGNVVSGIAQNKFTAKEIKLLSALLEYGAAAQASFNYTVNGLATDVEGLVEVEDVELDTNAFSESYYGASVNLESNLTFNFKFFAEAASTAAYAKVGYLNENGTMEYLTEELSLVSETKKNQPLWVVKFDTLLVSDAAMRLTCVLFDENGNELVSAEDSILCYCSRAINGLTTMKDANPSQYSNQKFKEDFYQALANYVVNVWEYQVV